MMTGSPFKKIAKALLESGGYRLVRVPAPSAATDSSLETLRTKLAGVTGTPVLLDVGARGGVNGRWADLHRAGLVAITAVEPDQQECRVLEARFPGIQVLPWALGDDESERTLYRTRLPDCSSVLEPHTENLREFPVKAWFDVVGTERVRLRRYDNLVTERMAPVPTFVKIDVQGFEWNVLEGLGAVLEEVVAIELEAHFVPLYRGERTAFELLPYLRQRGFILRHVEKQGPFEEEFLEGNFFFSRRPQNLSARDQVWLSAWESVCGIPKPFRFSTLQGA